MSSFALLLLVCSTSLSTVNPTQPLTDVTSSVSSANVVGHHNPKNTSEFIAEDSLQYLYDVIGLKKLKLSFEVFRYGMIGYQTLRQQGRLGDKNLLSIIDFTKASTQKRFYTIDLDNLVVKYFTYVSHGKNTGENMASAFSNRVHSNQSSLGFFVTGETYTGSKGYSLRLDGMDKGYNDKVRERAVVIHEADYVSESWIERYGRLGRSQGCPALPPALSAKIINTIKEHTALFAYYNDDQYLQNSAYLKKFAGESVQLASKQTETISGTN